MELARLIRSIPDFPVKGILFRDITTLIRDGDALQEVIDTLVERYIDSDVEVVAAVEARGWIFGAPLAYELGAGFVPIRKPSKLPAETISVSYSLEYGTNKLEMSGRLGHTVRVLPHHEDLENPLKLGLIIWAK